MLEKTTIARPYAQAAFEFARESGDLEHWSSMLGLLADIVSDPGMQQLLHNPKVSEAQLEEIVVGVDESRFAETDRNYIRILIEAGRLRYTLDVARMFKAMVAEAEGRLDVEVVPAYELEEGQEQTLSDAMAKRYAKEIRISSRVEESLIGGAIIRAGDSVVDASIRGRLNELRNDLA